MNIIKLISHFFFLFVHYLNFLFSFTKISSNNNFASLNCAVELKRILVSETKLISLPITVLQIKSFLVLSLFVNEFKSCTILDTSSPLHLDRSNNSQRDGYFKNTSHHKHIKIEIFIISVKTLFTFDRYLRLIGI